LTKLSTKLKPTLSQQAFNGLKGQLKPNEQLAGDPQCATQSSEDQPIGDQGDTITSANVTVNATCTGLVYDASGAQALAQNLLKSEAANDLGQGYVLAGTIMTKQTVTDMDNGVVTLQVAVAGTWYYQLHELIPAKQLVNKSRTTAQTLLSHSKGVVKVSINMANGSDTLPSDPNQISITIAQISGASLKNLPDLPTMQPANASSLSRGRG
jgi:hypothetical protein